MQDDRVWSRSNDWPESIAPGAPLGINKASGSFDLVLVHSGSRSLHRLFHAFGTDLSTPFNQFDFIGCFDPAHLIQQRVQGLQRKLWDHLLNNTDCFLRFGNTAKDRLRHLERLVEVKLLARILDIPLRTHEHVELLGASSQKSEHWKKLFDWLDSRQAISFFFLLHLPDAWTLSANLWLRTPGHEQKRTLSWTTHDEDCAGLFDSRQIIKIRSLAKLDWIELAFGGEDHGDAVGD